MTQFPTPALEGDSAPFWLALQAGRLDVQSCGACAALRHPPSPVCRACGSQDVVWATMSGRAEVWSHTTVHPPTLPAFAAETPYHAYVVRLDEGPFLVARAVPGAASPLPIGATVEIVPDVLDNGVVLPAIRPIGSRESGRSVPPEAPDVR